MNLTVGQQRGVVVVAAATAAMSGFIDQTIVGVALPTIRSDLDLSGSQALWVMSAYLLPLAGFAAAFGTLGRLVHERWLFSAGISVFVTGSMAAGLSAEGGWLIAARAIQGVGAAAMFTAAQAMVANAFPRTHRGRGIAIYAFVTTLALSVGPLLGGVLTDTLGWRWIFLVNPVLALLSLPYILGASRSLSPNRQGIENHSFNFRSFDYPGLFLLISGLTLTTYGLLQSVSRVGLEETDSGWISISFGVILLIGMVLRSRTRLIPVVNFSLLSRPAFLAATVVIIAVGLMQVWTVVSFPHYLQSTLGLSAFAAGAGLVPLTIALTLGQLVAGRSVDRFGPRTPIVIGLSALLSGVLVILVTLHTRQYWVMIPGLSLMGVGLAMCQTPANTAAMNAVHADERTQVSGLLGTTRQTSGLIGLVVWSALGSLVASWWSDPGAGGTVSFAVGLMGIATTLLMAIMLIITVLRPGRARQ